MAEQPGSPAHQPYLTRDAARAIDRDAIEEFGIPGVVLMENAARSLLNTAWVMLGEAETRSVTIVCGTGNNGGDGFALARHLANAMFDVECVLVGDRADVRGDALTNLSIAEKMGVPVRDAPAFEKPALIVDALFGTGLSRPIEGRAAEMVGWINGRHDGGSLVLAADVPSGLDCDTGLPLGDAVVRADRTTTFVLMKRGFGSATSREHTGVITVGEIGVPGAVILRHAMMPEG